MKKRFLIILSFLVLSAAVSAQPSAPTGLTAKVENWHGIPFVLVKWNSTNMMSVRYLLYRFYTDANDSVVVNKIHIPFFMSKFHDFKVKRGFTYNYYLIAYNRQGRSNPSDTVSVTLDSVSASALIYGNVTDETNSPLKNVTVAVIPRMGMFPEKTRTDSLGNYSLKLTPGEYYLAFFKGGFYPYFYDNQKSIFSANAIDLNNGDSLEINGQLKRLIKNKYYTIEGNVTDSAGAPLKAKVKALSLKGRFFTRISPPAFTDSTGHFKLKVVQGDSVVIFARPFNADFSAEFYNNKKDFAEADPLVVNSDLTGINFVLETKKPFNTLLSGRLSDENGNALVGAVSLFKLRNFGKGRIIKKTTLTDSTGKFEFKNIPVGNYFAFAVARGRYKPTFFRYDSQQTFRLRYADTIVVKENAPVTGINFILYSIPDSGYARVAGVVKDVHGNKIQGAMAFAVNQNNMVISFAASNSEGVYTLPDLPPGTYNIYFEKAGFRENNISNLNLDYANNLSATENVTITSEAVTEVKDNNQTGLRNFELYQNYPNPFNPTTVIKYVVPQKSLVKLTVYNIIGQKIKTLVNQIKNPGVYSVNFNAGKLPSGIYFYTLTAGNKTLTKRMVLIK